MKKKILILANENERAAIACLRALAKYETEVFIAFSNSSKRNSLIFKKYPNQTKLNYNKSSKENFIKSLIDIKLEIGEYFIFNFGDTITRWIIENRDELQFHSIKIKAPNLESYDAMLNKGSFLEWCENFELDIPTEIQQAEVYLEQRDFTEKFVVKAKSNVISKDSSVLSVPMLIENKKSWLKFKSKKLDLKKHFIQLYIEGPSVYYCAHYNSGQKSVNFIQKNVVQQPGGKSVIKAVPSQLPNEIINKIDNIMETLRWEGVMMVEFKEQNKKYYAIECNPRFWGPLQLAIDNGVNFPLHTVSSNNSCKQPKISKKHGYVWVTGYLLGFLYKLQTGTKFQVHDKQSKDWILYKDIWFRKDTFLYSISEFFFTLYVQLIRMFK